MADAPKNTTKFGKGNPGKPKGAKNKVTQELREMVLEALDRSGGVDYLAERAIDPKTAGAFLTLIGKIIPTTVKGDMKVSGGVVIIPAKADA
jgi:hypothetical protein